MRKKTLMILLACNIALLAACGSHSGSGNETMTSDAQTASQQAADSGEAVFPASEDGQNPVMNFVGAYNYEGSTEALVEADGSETAKITVTYAGSPWFQSQTVMSGPFDPETFT